MMTATASPPTAGGTALLNYRPYRGKLELVSRMVIPQSVYERIKHEIGVSDEATDAPIEVAI